MMRVGWFMLLVAGTAAHAQTLVKPGGSPLQTLRRANGIKVEVLPGQVRAGSEFAVRSQLAWIRETAEVANCVIKQSGLIRDVERVRVFDLAVLGDQRGPVGVAVAKRMQAFTPVIVSTYCKYPSGGVQTNAYRNVGSNVVYINTCVPRNPLASRVNTLVHERLHVVGFGHGDNSWRGKQNTVPYRVGTLAEKYTNACNPKGYR